MLAGSSPRLHEAQRQYRGKTGTERIHDDVDHGIVLALDDIRRSQHVIEPSGHLLPDADRHIQAGDEDRDKQGLVCLE